MRQRCPEREVAGEKKEVRKRSSGDYTGESTITLLSLTIEPNSRKMKELRLHLKAAAFLLPCFLALTCDGLLLKIAALAYAACLFRLARTAKGKAFLRSYYAEVLRCERLLK